MRRRSIIPGSELYQSLSSGVVDGAHWGAAVGAQSMSLWEVCKYHYKPAMAQTTDAIILNTDALEDLDDDVRTTLTDIIESRFFQRSTEYQYAEAVALNEGVANEGIEVVDFPEDVLELLSKREPGDARRRSREGRDGGKGCRHLHAADG